MLVAVAAAIAAPLAQADAMRKHEKNDVYRVKDAYRVGDVYRLHDAFRLKEAYRLHDAYRMSPWKSGKLGY